MSGDFTAGHPLFSGASQAPAPSATSEALSSFAPPPPGPAPREAANPREYDDEFYRVAGQYGLAQSESGPSDSARWIIDYALQSVGIDGPGEFRSWLSQVLGAAARANGGRLRGAADARAYIEQSNAVVQQRGW